jgi:hypothetical protein
MVKTRQICIADQDPTMTQAFLCSRLSGGSWSLLARRYYPIGFLGVRTFRSRNLPSIFALIGTWTSANSLETERRSPASRVFECLQCNLTSSTINCGVSSNAAITDK